MPFKSPDIFEAFAPEIFGQQRWGSFLALQHLRVHSHDEHLFVVGAVENPNVSALGKSKGGSPQKVMLQLRFRRGLKGIDLTALRIHPRHHMLDSTVLPRRVHALENEQNSPTILGVKFVLQLSQARNTLLQSLVRMLF